MGASTNSWSPHREGSSVLASIAVGLVLWLLIVAPLGAAAPSTLVVRDLPPYHLAKVIDRNITSVSCNDSFSTSYVRYATPAQPHNDIAGFTTGSLARDCTGYVSTFAHQGLLGPSFTVSSNGTYTAEYKWGVSWYAADSGGGANVSGVGCQGTYNVDALLFGNLRDNTTKTWISSGNGSQGVRQGVFKVQGDACAAWNSTGGMGYGPGPWGNGAKNFSLHISASLVAGHQYLFYSGIEEWANLTLSNSACPGYCEVNMLVELAPGAGGSYNGAVSKYMILV
jgi:hypothetical protein